MLLPYTPPRRTRRRTRRRAEVKQKERLAASSGQTRSAFEMSEWSSLAVRGDGLLSDRPATRPRIVHKSVFHRFQVLVRGYGCAIALNFELVYYSKHLFSGVFECRKYDVDVLRDRRGDRRVRRLPAKLILRPAWLKQGVRRDDFCYRSELPVRRCGYFSRC